MMWGDGMGWMWLFRFLLAAGVLVLVFVLVKSLTGPSRGSRSGKDGVPTRPESDRARGILQERYARGEISAEEYRERLRILDEGNR